MKHPDRYMFAAITMAGVLAASLAAEWTGSGLAAVAAYVAVVASLAHVTGQPAVRTVGATLLTVVATLILTLRAVRALLDGVLWFLHTSSQGVLLTVKAVA